MVKLNTTNHINLTAALFLKLLEIIAKLATTTQEFNYNFLNLKYSG